LESFANDRSKNPLLFRKSFLRDNGIKDSDSLVDGTGPVSPEYPLLLASLESRFVKKYVKNVVIFMYVEEVLFVTKYYQRPQNKTV
jgi:hypothetical protein